MMKKYLLLSATSVALTIGSLAQASTCTETVNSAAVASLRAKGIETHVVDIAESNGAGKASDFYATLLATCPNIGSNGQLNPNEIVIITGAKKGLWFSANLKGSLYGQYGNMGDAVKAGDPAAALKIANDSTSFSPLPATPPQAYQAPQPQVRTERVITQTHVVHHGSGMGFFGYLGVIVAVGVVGYVLYNWLTPSVVIVGEPATPYRPPAPTGSAAPPRRRRSPPAVNYPQSFNYGGQVYTGSWYNGAWGFYSPAGFMPWGYYDTFGVFSPGTAFAIEGLILGEMLAADIIMSSNYGYNGYLGDSYYQDTIITDTTTTTYDGGQGYQDQGYQDVGGDLGSQGDVGGDLDQQDQGGDLGDQGDVGGNLGDDQDTGGGFDDQGGSDDAGGGFDDSGSSDDSGGDL